MHDGCEAGLKMVHRILVPRMHYGLVWLYTRTRTNRWLVIQLEAYDNKVGSKPTLNWGARAILPHSEAHRALLSEMDMGFI